MKKAILGLLVSALLIYLSVKDTDFQRVISGMTKMGYGYILPFLFIMLLMQALRAWRWGLILNPLEKIAYLPLFAITSAGFLAITALPARLGELARPYLVARKSAIRMSAAVGTIFVERILDGAAILTITSATAFFTILPAWLLKANVIFFIINLILFLGVFFALFRRPLLLKFLNFSLRILPEKWPEKWKDTLNRLLHHFLEGFQVIGDGKRFFQILLLSFLIWLIDALAIYILFLAFKFQLPPVAAFVLMIILIIGIAIPTAPGFIGNWHFSCVLGLGIFGINKTDALTFAIIYHFLAVGLVVVLGLGFFPCLKLSFADLRKEAGRALS
ncbi:MAG TPA: lysylphosphatidylglycerol synthase transmembrane domain-containing protein [Syntrophales bacterium]|nr:lysylphosphatidylglycerol synthase transmembrane domain-containing protein [Syntrophales bacterium]